MKILTCPNCGNAAEIKTVRVYGVPAVIAKCSTCNISTALFLSEAGLTEITETLDSLINSSQK